MKRKDSNITKSYFLNMLNKFVYFQNRNQPQKGNKMINCRKIEKSPLNSS